MSVLPPQQLADAGLAGLLALVAEGDPASFTELYHRTVAQVLGVATAMLGDTAVAQDVTAAVYQEVWRTAHRYDPAHGSAFAWLMAVTHRHTVRRLRASRDPASTTTAQVTALPAALPQLDPPARELILLVYYGGCTVRQAASLLGLPPGTAGPCLRAALHTLSQPPQPGPRAGKSRRQGRHRRGASALEQPGDTVR